MTAATDEIETVPRRRRMHPALRWGIVALAIVVGLVVIDTGVRLIVQWRVAVAVEEALPSGVTADVDARVHGFSAIAQLATGSLEHLELRTDDLTVLGVTIAARVDGYGVSLGDGAVPTLSVEQLTGSLHVSQDAINRLVPIPGATGGVTLGEDVVGYSTTLSILGLDLAVDIEATVRMEGERLVIQATKLDVVGGAVDFDAAELLENSVIAVPICTAEYLPAGIHLSDVSVDPEGVTVSITANRVDLDETTLETRGTCR